MTEGFEKFANCLLITCFFTFTMMYISDQAKLERMQEDLSDDMPPACKSLRDIAEGKQEKFNRAVGANQRGEPGAYALSGSPIKANDAVRACVDADEKPKRVEGGLLWIELCTTAGVPAN